MTTDHNEAMRLADALLMGEAMIPEIDLPEAAALLRKQAAELKSARAETNRIIALLDAANDERKALRADVEQLKLAEEGAAQAFGDVVQQKRDLEAEVKRLQSLLDGAYASIREYADTARKATP